MKLSTGFGVFESALEARLSGDTEEFWRLVNHWWYGEYVDKPRARAISELGSLLDEFNVSTSRGNIPSIAATITSGSWVRSSYATSSLFNISRIGLTNKSEGYWLVGNCKLYTEVKPTRLGKYLVRVLLGVRYYSA